MSNPIFQRLQEALSQKPQRWLVTGAAGFIGSNLVEALLRLGQEVVGLDNFSTGRRGNIAQVETLLPEAKSRFRFIEGDIRDAEACREACRDVDLVLHQAALGSVPRSIEFPVQSVEANIGGFFQILTAAKDAGIKRFVYASSSSVYGDHPALPKREENTGKLLSPYAMTKFVNELGAEVFHRTYGIDCIGLRYFNVFGARQDPDGAYAAVIPLWIKSLMNGQDVFINGDGETSRDFCYVENAVQANILAATTTSPDAVNRVYNVSCGRQTTLNQLYSLLRAELEKRSFNVLAPGPVHREFRQGDIRHSLADVSLAREKLGYEPEFQVDEGIQLSIDWYLQNLRA